MGGRIGGIRCNAHPLSAARQRPLGCDHAGGADHLYRRGSRDRENPLTDYHPAFHHHDADDDHASTEHILDADGEAVLAVSAVDDTVALFTALGWAESTVRASVEYICERLARAGNRATAFEALRRDKHARALLDLPASSWHGLLRTVLGNPEPVYVGTSHGRGVLLRLLIGEPVPVLLRDDDLVLTITAAIPVRGGGRE